MWRRIRRIVQVAAAAALLSPLAGFSFFLGTYSASLLLHRFQFADPYAALQVGVLPLAAAAAPVVVLNVVLGRVFCGWFCPLGFLLEGVAWLRRRLGLRDRDLPPWVRWPLAATLVIGSFAVALPLFEWLSPQANLARLLLFGLAWEAMVIPVVLLADLLIARRLWCRTLCPAGVTYGLMARAGALRVALADDRCHRCGDCLTVCPQGRLTLQEAVGRRGPVLVADPQACIACGECLDVCSKHALSLRWDPSPDPGRRRALVTLGAAALAAVAARPALALSTRPRAALRPPGAQPEGLLQALCIRCGKCAQECPRQAIRLASAIPYVVARTKACDLCRKCPPVCPTKALSLGPTEPIRMGVAEIDQDRCLAWNGTLCRSCFVACPLQGQAIRLDQSSGIWKPIIDPKQCAGCGLCEQNCPADPTAIAIRF